MNLILIVSELIRLLINVLNAGFSLASPLAPRNFRLEVLWDIGDVLSHGIVLTSQCNINQGCPDYNPDQQTLNLTSLIFSPFKYSFVSLSTT